MLGRGESDTINALWPLFLGALEKFAAGKDSVLSFPGRRFEMGLSRIHGGKVKVRVEGSEGKRVTVGNADKLIKSLTKGAADFFQVSLDTSSRAEWSYRRDLNAALSNLERQTP
ncbi:hypothetical protein ACX9I7_08655 [Streptomyces sp. L500]